MKASSINDTLKKKKSDFRYWPHGINTMIIKAGCKKCGAEIVCAYTDMGVTDFCDTYNHICVNDECDFIEKDDDFSIGMGTREESGPKPCPFCQRKVK